MPASKSKQNDFTEARPDAGDLMDRFLENKLRAALFGEQQPVTLGRLEIRASLGNGAMGVVLSAFDPVLDRLVAIKSLRHERGENSEQLLREARMLAKLDHPQYCVDLRCCRGRGRFVLAPGQGHDRNSAVANSAGLGAESQTGCGCGGALI